MGNEKEYVMNFTHEELEIIMQGLSELPFKKVTALVNKINDSYVKQYTEWAQKQNAIAEEEMNLETESKGAKHNE